MKIRASTLNDYLDCPRRAAAANYADIIEGHGFTLREKRPHVGACIGTSAHKSSEFILVNRPKLSDAVEIGIEEFKKISGDGVEWDSTTPERNTAEHQVKSIILTYFHDVAPGVVPIDWQGRPGTEIYLEGDLGDGVKLTGHMDVFDGAMMTPRDTKSGMRDKLFFSQLGGYVLLAMANGLDVQSNPIIDWVPRPKKKEGAKYFRMDYDKDVCSKTAYNITQKIKQDVNNFEKTSDPWSFTPNINSTLCSNKFCPAHGTDFCELTKSKPERKEVSL